MCFTSCHFFLSNTRRESFKWLMTKMAPDFSFRKAHFLCLKCNEKNIHQCWALECGYSQLINHKPLSICWSQSLAWESAVFLTYLLCSHLSAQAQASQAMPRWPPGPKRPPPYSVAAQSLSRVWLFATSWTEAHQAPLSSSDSWSLLKFMSTELLSRSNHLTLCSTLLLCFQSFPASGSCPMNWLFTSGGLSIGA